MDHIWERFIVDDNYNADSLVQDTDLQVHSFFSDGKDDPEDLVKQAVTKELKVLSITDHFSIRAYTDKLLQYANSLSLTLVPGLEIEVEKDVDILVYCSDLNEFAKFTNDINMLLSEKNGLRINEATKLIDELKDYFQNNPQHPQWLLWNNLSDEQKKEALDYISIENAMKINLRSFELNETSKREYIGKPHIAALLKKYDLIDWGKFAEAYGVTDKKKLLKKSYQVLFKEIVQWKETEDDPTFASSVTQLSYIKILAHPGRTYFDLHETFSKENYFAFLDMYIKKYNLDGAECFYENYEEDGDMYNALTLEFLTNLSKTENKRYFGTGGSDTHGSL